MNKSMMPDFLQHCEGAALCERSHGDDSEVRWCSFCADLETNPSTAGFCRNKAELCACWEAPSKCQVCVTHKHCAVHSSTVQMNIYFFCFLLPPPHGAALKSDFPTI